MLKGHYVDCEGSLIRASDLATIRTNYYKHHSEIKSGQDLLACLRAGENTFLFGYRLAFICSDGGVLCFDCVRDNLHLVIDSIRNDISDGWQVVGCGTLHADPDPINCDHCNADVSV